MQPSLVLSSVTGMNEMLHTSARLFFFFIVTPVNALHLAINGVSRVSCFFSFSVGYGASYDQ